MRLFVPEIGTQFVLTERWNFQLYNEDRNRSLVEAWDLFTDPGYINAREAYRNNPRNRWSARYTDGMLMHMIDYSWPVSLDVGTILKVDRIFIRKGMNDYSSLTFYVSHTTDPALSKVKKRRFWAKLSDCNQIECEVENENS